MPPLANMPPTLKTWNVVGEACKLHHHPHHHHGKTWKNHNDGLRSVGDSFEKAGKADAGRTLQYIRQWMRNEPKIGLKTRQSVGSCWQRSYNDALSGSLRTSRIQATQIDVQLQSISQSININHMSRILQNILAHVLHQIAIVFVFKAAKAPSFTQPSTADQTSQHHQPWRPLYSWRCKG